MKRKNATRNALFTSILSLLLCVSMLVSATFAWFTDEVTTGMNTIAAGNLDVELKANGADVDSETELFDDVELWEPGVVVYENLQVVNEGTLALKYRLALNIGDENYLNGHGLSEVLKVAVIDKVADNATRADVLAAAKAAVADDSGEGYLSNFTLTGALAPKDKTETIDGVEYSDKSLEKTFVIFWEPNSAEVDNLYNANNNQTTSDGEPLHIEFGVNLQATQLMYEKDSFDNTYDEGALYPVSGVGDVSKAVYDNDAAGYEVPVFDQSTDLKIGSVVIPASALAEGVTIEDVQIGIAATAFNSNVTVADDETASTYNITVTGLRENNDDPVKVTLNIGVARNDVKVFHYDDEIDVTYNPYVGYAIFSETSFSPFTVVYDVEKVDISTQEPDDSTSNEELPEGFPTASVTREEKYENVDLPWGSYGAWSPTEGLDSQLEAAYIFACTETLEEVQSGEYADWYCDFYVKLDKDLGENEIFLGGNYGSFGWVGFHNGDLTLEANTEIPLLGSVAGNPWSYEDVVANVGTFICGVGDVDDALTGATFTVMLRLTNPADETEFYDVATINYTFE